MTKLSSAEYEFIELLKNISYDTLFKLGNNSGEKSYQLLLEENIRIHNYKVMKEDVFQAQYTDIQGNPVRLGHNTSFRTDLEIPSLKLLLELKQSSSGNTKEIHMTQLYNYMVHRCDIDIGAVVNFISKDKEHNNPFVEITVVKKTGETRQYGTQIYPHLYKFKTFQTEEIPPLSCLLYTSDAADE